LNVFCVAQVDWSDEVLEVRNKYAHIEEKRDYYGAFLRRTI